MEELRINLIQTINQAGVNLPLEAIFYVVKDVYRDVEESYRNLLKSQEVQKQKETLHAVIKEEEEK